MSGRPKNHKYTRNIIHYIKVKTVNEILLKSIKEITDFAKEEKQEFLKVMNKLSDEKRDYFIFHLFLGFSRDFNSAI